VIYRPLENGIDVLRVLHSSRQWRRVFFGDDQDLRSLKATPNISIRTETSIPVNPARLIFW